MTYKNYLESLGFRPATIKSYTYIVEKFLESKKKPLDYLSKFNGTYKNNIIKILHHYYNYLCDESPNLKNPMLKIKQIRAENKLPKFADTKRISEILNNVDDIRALAILELGIATGARTNEISLIKLEDLDLENKTVKLFRKGGVHSIKDLTDQATEAINKYLKQRNSNCEYLFVNENGERLISIYYAIKPYLRDLTPHQFFRHSLAIGLIRNKMDLDQIRRVLDHKNIATTSNYLRAIDPNLTEELKRKHPRG